MIKVLTNVNQSDKEKGTLLTIKPKLEIKSRKTSENVEKWNPQKNEIKSADKQTN